MPQCYNCSAPLPANTNRCRYCGTRNDVDLRNGRFYAVSQDNSERTCPHCEEPLQTISVRSRTPLSIERCRICYGLFFDTGEIETLLTDSLPDVFDINLEHIRSINQDRYRTGGKVKYIKCPVCGILMNRVNFGYRSGVVVDRCKSHGVWLDNGEITHLMEWRKAGGQLLHEKNVQRSRETKKLAWNQSSLNEKYSDHCYSNTVMDNDLIETLSSVIFKLFD